MKSFKNILQMEPGKIVRVFGASISNPKIYNGEYAKVISPGGIDSGKVSQSLVRVCFGNGSPAEVFHFRQLRTS